MWSGTVEDSCSKLREYQHIQTVRIKAAMKHLNFDSFLFGSGGKLFQQRRFARTRPSLDENPSFQLSGQALNKIECPLGVAAPKNK